MLGIICFNKTNFLPQFFVRGNKDIFDFAECLDFDGYTFTFRNIDIGEASVKKINCVVRDSYINFDVQVEYTPNGPGILNGYMDLRLLEMFKEKLQEDLNDKFSKVDYTNSIPAMDCLFYGRKFYTKFSENEKQSYVLQILDGNIISRGV